MQGCINVSNYFMYYKGEGVCAGGWPSDDLLTAMSAFSLTDMTGVRLNYNCCQIKLQL